MRNRLTLPIKLVLVYAAIVVTANVITALGTDHAHPTAFDGLLLVLVAAPWVAYVDPHRISTSIALPLCYLANSVSLFILATILMKVGDLASAYSRRRDR